MEVANTEQAEFWSAMAPTWVTLRDHLDLAMAPPGDWAMAALSPQPGEDILDIGCGSGETTVELAARVSPGGSALGLDIAEGMLEAAREIAHSAGASGVEFRCADVQSEDLGEAVFDAAYSRFGVMFFADPGAAFANVHRALRPGGRIAFACWQGGLENEWMLVPGMAAMSVVGEFPVPAAEEPGPFAFADAERVRAILAGAGFSSIEIDARNDAVVLPEDGVARHAMVASQVGAVRAALAEAGEELRAEAVAAIEAALRERLVDGVVSLARGSYIVSAKA